MENYNIRQIMQMKRDALGYTRKELADRCGYASEKTLARLEKGEGKVRRESIRELLNLYHQRSHTIFPSIDLEDPTAGKMYSEILMLTFRKNFREARRKLEIFEQHVRKESKESVQYLEVLKRELLYFMNQKEVDGEETICFFEKMIAGMLPEDADLAKWPLNWQELHTYMAFFNVLMIEKQYGRIVPIVRQLLINIERQYQNIEMFANIHGCFTRCLLRCLFEQDQCTEMVELAQKSLSFCAAAGDISNTYRIQGELLNYFWKHDYFHDDDLKEQCLETIKNMYYLSKVCQDQKKTREFRNYLWLMDYLNGSQRIKANTVHSKYSTQNYTNLQYTALSVVQAETGRCKAVDGYHSNAEIDENPNGGGYFGTRRIFCGTEGY